MSENTPELTPFEQMSLELLSAQYIQLARIYDYLSVIADKLGIDSLAIKEIHEQGGTFAPAPYLKEEE